MMWVEYPVVPTPGRLDAHCPSHRRPVDIDIEELARRAQLATSGGADEWLVTFDQPARP
jgi:hypothetical protein